jgi:predicted neuraminidase
MSKNFVAIAKREAIGSAECHASTLLVLPNEEFSCAWFAGSKEGNADTAIWLSSRRNSVWTEPERITKVSNEPHWNPVLFADGDVIYLFFKVGTSPREWRTYWMSRPLATHSWNRPEELVAGDIGGRGPVKNKPIELENGDWLAPASIETPTAWYCFIDRSSDLGKTWQRGESIGHSRTLTGLGAIQPTLWSSGNGNVHMLARTTAGKIYRADSQDGGRTWTEAYATALPNNNSGIDLVKLDDRSLILASNPSDRNWGARTPLTLALSEDNGRNWAEIWAVENQPGEYSYPALVKTNSGFALSYTANRQQIRFWHFACNS